MNRAQIIELISKFSLQGRSFFNDTAKVLNQLQIDILEKQPIYEIPLKRELKIDVSH